MQIKVSTQSSTAEEVYNKLAIVSAEASNSSLPTNVLKLVPEAQKQSPSVSSAFCESGILKQTENIFFQAFLLSLRTGRSLELNSEEAEHVREWSGVLSEGTAMALALLDLITPWKKTRWSSFVSGEGSKHLYAVYVARGMALAYLKKPITKQLSDLDKTWQWLVIDGYGFHCAYNNPQKYINEQQLPKSINSNYAKRVFYQGVGRSLWFAKQGQIAEIIQAINTYPKAYQSDLWSGLGVACTYTGGLDEASLKKLGKRAGKFKSSLSLGATFAAMIRKQAGNPAAHTDTACQIFCRLSAAEAAKLAEDSLTNISEDEASFEIWRQRIQNYFSQGLVTQRV